MLNKITVLGFPGDNLERGKSNLFNLNKKVYNKYSGFKDFQMVMIVPESTKAVNNIINEFTRLTKEQSVENWHFVFVKTSSENKLILNFSFQNTLDVHTQNSIWIYIDKNLSLRGRKRPKN